MIPVLFLAAMLGQDPCSSESLSQIGLQAVVVDSAESGYAVEIRVTHIGTPFEVSSRVLVECSTDLIHNLRAVRPSSQSGYIQPSVLPDDLPVHPTFVSLPCSPELTVGVFNFALETFGRIDYVPDANGEALLFTLLFESDFDQPINLRFRTEYLGRQTQLGWVCGGPHTFDEEHLVGTTISPPLFVRGDFNADGTVGIDDVLGNLNYLFLGGLKASCQSASDTNDDGHIDVTDAIVALLYLFLAGTQPTAPFPEAGLDPTPDNLDCINSS